MEMSELRVRGVLTHFGYLLVIRRVINEKGIPITFYALPGGHVQEGEELEAAVIRAIKEETGLAVRVAMRCAHQGMPVDANRVTLFMRVVLTEQCRQLPILVAEQTNKQDGVRTPNWLSLSAVERAEFRPSETRAVLRAELALLAQNDGGSVL